MQVAAISAPPLSLTIEAPCEARVGELRVATRLLPANAALRTTTRGEMPARSRFSTSIRKTSGFGSSA